MGRVRHNVLKGLFTSSTTRKAKREAEQKAAADKKAREVLYYKSLSSGADKDPEVQEYRATLKAEAQKRVSRRAAMIWNNKRSAVASGIDVLLPNAISFQVSTRGFRDDGGAERQMYLLGDGVQGMRSGHAALQLVGVDIKALTDWMDQNADSGITAQILRHGSEQALHDDTAIYASARIVSFTSDPGDALQPGWEFAKQLATNVSGGLGTGSDLGDLGKASAEIFNDRFQAHRANAPKLPKAIEKAQKVVAEHRMDQDFSVKSVKTAVAIDFSLAPQGGKQIGQRNWYFRQRHNGAFPDVMAELSRMWHGR